MTLHKILVQRDAQPRPIRNLNIAIHRLNFLMRQFMPQRRICHAVFNKNAPALSQWRLEATVTGLV